MVSLNTDINVSAYGGSFSDDRSLNEGDDAYLQLSKSEMKDRIPET